MPTPQSLKFCIRFIGFFIFFLSISYLGRSQDNQIINYKGNSFELWSDLPDTLYIENIETKEREMKISVIDSMPIKMNGIKIFSGQEIQSPALPERSMDEYFIDLATKNKELFGQLSDGRYKLHLRHFVVNEEGKIVYYKFEGIKKIIPKRANTIPAQTIAKDENEQVNLIIDKLVRDYIETENIKFKAAEINNKKVLSMANGAYVRITIKDHQMTVDL